MVIKLIGTKYSYFTSQWYSIVYYKKGESMLKKKIITTIITVCCIVIMYVVLHSTPYVALRIHLLMTGHSVSSFTTKIVDDELHNKIDKQILESQNAKCYTLTKPAFEKATQSNLRNYKVTKKGFLFYAEYYGEA